MLRRFLMRSSTRDLRASASGRLVGLESLLVEGVRLEPLFGTADLRVRREDMVVGGGATRCARARRV